MLSKDELCAALEGMILSASGWRGVFAVSGGEEDKTPFISPALRIIAAAGALAFAEYLGMARGETGRAPVVLVGSDTRPTGRAIAEAVIPVLLSSGCAVRFAGVTAAPEIMAWARSLGSGGETPSVGFIFISASHNPIGHNGLKFGLADGGVLAPEAAGRLIAGFRSLLAAGGCAARVENLINGADSAGLRSVYAAESAAKNEARNAYLAFSAEVAWGAAPALAAALKAGLAARPLGIACDFNGSARTVSIDRDFLSGLGLQFEAINDQPGEIAHRFVPEGESLDPCRVFLEELHGRVASFMLGYVTDCDGDRGNLVVWDEALAKARPLEAQEVFALACVAELAHLVWTGELAYDNKGNALSKAAIAVNDPTSMRVDRIATAFDVSVFRAEVGEANVVGLARRLREKGYIVRILGEGSAGGNITHPSAVRDPINTVLALVKLLSVRSAGGRPGLFELWCDLSGQAELYHEDYGLADIIASLPPFVTTGAYAEEAVLRLTTTDHGLLKDRYQELFLREWEERKDTLKARYGIQGWEALAYNGMEEKRGLARFGDAGKGGLKICFHNGEGKTVASIWMRGSATEPVFRIMADAEGQDRRIERDLIEWQRRMVRAADTARLLADSARQRGQGANMGVRGELFSTRVLLPNRTYFFNVKENRMGDLYLNIVESKNREEGGFDRQSVILFADDLQEFLKGFDESLRVMEKAVREQRKTGRAEKVSRDGEGGYPGRREESGPERPHKGRYGDAGTERPRRGRPAYGDRGGRESSGADRPPRKGRSEYGGRGGRESSGPDENPRKGRPPKGGRRVVVKKSGR
jgi:phosphoglucomutase